MVPESQLKWERENMYVISAKLHRKYDSDLVEYMQAKKSKSDTIKRALRLLMEHEQKNINGGKDQ